MKATSLGSAVARVSYPGCGVICGKSADGLSAVLACFIMGRSPLSKNRRFVEEGGGVKIEPFIPNVMRDHQTLLYSPVLAFDNCLLMGNGSQTEDVRRALKEGNSFSEAVFAQRCFSDAPHFTPRVTALADIDGSRVGLSMSVVKRMDNETDTVCRSIFRYDDLAPGVGCYLHSYECDANPLPPVAGEPVQVRVNGSIFDIVADIWENLNAENKVSLWVRTVDLGSGKSMSRIINKNR